MIITDISKLAAIKYRIEEDWEPHNKYIDPEAEIEKREREEELKRRQEFQRKMDDLRIG